MAEPLIRFVVVVHETRAEGPDLAERLVEEARAHGVHAVATVPGAAIDPDTDVVVGIGGDGTLLQAAAVAYPLDVPVIGVNLGTVGYLTDVQPEAIDKMVAALAGGDYLESHRMTVAATTRDGTWHGLNDVVLDKVITQRVVELTVEIDGQHFTKYRADGVIVATPLGSTAYSLSAGGPVVDPKLDALILTPVAPHSLLSRSLVLSDEATIEITVSGERPASIHLDGREAAILESGESVTVTRGERPARFLSLDGGQPFPQGVRRQFGLDHA